MSSVLQNLSFPAILITYILESIEQLFSAPRCDTFITVKNYNSYLALRFRLVLITIGKYFAVFSSYYDLRVREKLINLIFIFFGAHKMLLQVLLKKISHNYLQKLTKNLYSNMSAKNTTNIIYRKKDWCLYQNLMQ